MNSGETALTGTNLLVLLVAAVAGCWFSYGLIRQGRRWQGGLLFMVGLSSLTLLSLSGRAAPRWIEDSLVAVGFASSFGLMWLTFRRMWRGG